MNSDVRVAVHVVGILNSLFVVPGQVHRSLITTNLSGFL